MLRNASTVYMKACISDLVALFFCVVFFVPNKRIYQHGASSVLHLGYS